MDNAPRDCRRSLVWLTIRFRWKESIPSIYFPTSASSCREPKCISSFRPFLTVRAYVVHYLVPVKLGGPHDSLIAKLVAFNSKVLDEDLEMIPSMQASMRAGSLTVLKLQYQERRIRRLHEDIDLRIGYADVPAAIHVPDVLGRYVEES
jgi:hypothetical protein